MKRKSLLVLMTFICASILSNGFSQNRSIITTGSLFEEMIDMTALAKFPNPEFRMVQFSSFDHRSTLPGGPDWFANSDGFGGEPIPNFEEVLKEPDESGIGDYLMADVKGSGAIVRLWTASISGKLRVYIDDMNNPLYEGEADSFFRRPYSSFPEIKEINSERFGKTIYQRDASYAPIPFAKRIRIEWIGNVKEIHFYQIQFRLYPANISITSFQPNDILTYKDVIDRVTLALSDPDMNFTTKSKKQSQNFDVTVPAGEKLQAFLMEGPAAIERFSLRITGDNLDKALRQTVLHIKCDGYPWGQVQSPVGDFFGAAPGVNPYKSLPFSVTSDGKMTCRYVMPFQDSIQIMFENQGEETVNIKGEVLPMDFTWDDNSMHFRARWRVNHNIVASNQDVQDLPFLLANGEGVYVGTTSYLLNPSPIPTPWGNWWGEGDEKVFVDDDFVPSIFGTGSEDYYNYSWSSPDIFCFPYCGQPRNDGPGNRGFVINYRWHILDPIPFHENMRFFMELFSHERTHGVSYARIAYHYAKPGLTDDHQAIMEEDLRQLSLPDGWHPASRFGARNSVFYPAEEIILNKESTIIRKGRLWADSQLLVWNPQKEGESKNFIIPIEQKGKKRIYITAALTPKSGKIRVILDGEPIAKDDRIINLHRSYRTLLRNFSFGPVELETGKHNLTLEYLGASDEIQAPEICIDFFWIQTLDN